MELDVFLPGLFQLLDFVLKVLQGHEGLTFLERCHLVIELLNCHKTGCERSNLLVELRVHRCLQFAHTSLDVCLETLARAQALLGLGFRFVENLLDLFLELSLYRQALRLAFTNLKLFYQSCNFAFNLRENLERLGALLSFDFLS